MTRFNISATRCSRVLRSSVVFTASATSRRYRSNAGDMSCCVGIVIKLELDLHDNSERCGYYLESAIHAGLTCVRAGGCGGSRQPIEFFSLVELQRRGACMPLPEFKQIVDEAKRQIQ